MKRLGLIGTFHETMAGHYPRTIDAEFRKEYSGEISPRLLIQTVDAAETHSLLAAESWDQLAYFLIAESKVFTPEFVDGVVLCGSRMQPLAEGLRDAIKVPVLSMGFAVAGTLSAFAIQRVGILGTCTQREDSMWSSVLSPRRVLLPSSSDRTRLCGILNESNRFGQSVPTAARFEVMKMISNLAKEGAQAVILAAPELVPLIGKSEKTLTLFDAAQIHASVAGIWASHSGFGPTPPCCLGTN